MISNSKQLSVMNSRPFQFQALPLRVEKQTALKFSAREVSPGRLLSFYLMASCGYYIFHKSLIQDWEFDKMAELLYLSWGCESVKNHPHAYLIEIEMLKNGGSAFYIDKYPLLVQGATSWALEQLEKNGKLPHR
jgi:hypothetical protein